MNTGEKISFQRKQNGLSQQALADELEISRQAVSRWETGEAVPDTEKIIRLAKIFNVNTDYLLLDEITSPYAICEQQTEQDRREYTADNSALIRARQRKFRTAISVFIFGFGLASLITSIIATAFYAKGITEWYTDLGKFGTTVLHSPWGLLILFCAVLTITGAYLIYREYRRTDI